MDRMRDVLIGEPLGRCKNALVIFLLAIIGDEHGGTSSPHLKTYNRNLRCFAARKLPDDHMVQ